MESPRCSIIVIIAVSAAWHSVIRAAEPAPTPTPRPSTLAALAAAAPAHRGTPGAPTPITITNANLAELADGAIITLSEGAAEPAAGPEVTSGPDAKSRSKWRSRVLTQRRKIATIEGRQRAVEAEINRLERGSLDSRTLDRIENAEAKLGAVEQELAAARRALSRIVQEARREGAQPGWFR